MDFKKKCLICGRRIQQAVSKRRSKETQKILDSWKNACSKSLSYILMGKEFESFVYFFNSGRFCSSCQQTIRDVNFTWKLLKKLQEKIDILSNCIRKRLFNNYRSIRRKSEKNDIEENLKALKNDNTTFNTYSYNQIVELIYTVAFRLSGGVDTLDEESNEASDSLDIKYEPVYFDADPEEQAEPYVAESSKEEISDMETDDLPKKLRTGGPSKEKIGGECKPSSEPKIRKGDTESQKKRRERRNAWRRKHRKPDPRYINSKKLIKCTYEDCPVTFRNEENMKFHIRQLHLGEQKPYECPKCLKRFGKSNILKMHIKNLHSGSRGYDHNCKFCGKGYAEEEELNSHYSGAHQGPNPFLCAFCDNVCSNTTDLRKHVIDSHPDHNRPQCNICNKYFVSQQTLNIHSLTHNDPDLLHKCTICNRVFATVARLKNHTEVHNTERNFTCHICGKNFHRREALRTHLRLHAEEKKFKCKVCEKGFFNAHSLKRHEITHTGVKDHVCATCGKSFAVRHNLTEHERIHKREIDPTIVVRKRKSNPKEVPQEETQPCSTLYFEYDASNIIFATEPLF